MLRYFRLPFDLTGACCLAHKFVFPFRGGLLQHVRLSAGMSSVCRQTICRIAEKKPKTKGQNAFFHRRRRSAFQTLLQFRKYCKNVLRSKRQRFMQISSTNRSTFRMLICISHFVRLLSSLPSRLACGEKGNFYLHLNILHTC